jgi:hypothetical protein
MLPQRAIPFNAATQAKTSRCAGPAPNRDSHCRNREWDAANHRSQARKSIKVSRFFERDAFNSKANRAPHQS